MTSISQLVLNEKASARLLAGVAFLLVAFTLLDPGLTVDEPINVGHGKAWVAALLRDPLAFADGPTVHAHWRRAHEHPPLARLLVGLSHLTLDPDPTNPATILPRNGRWASALAYAGILYVCVRWGWRLGGPLAGWSAGLATLLFPRLFAHGHLASPEVISTAFVLWAGWCVGTVVADIPTTGPIPRRVSLRVVAAGSVLGLALLTKLTAVLLVPAVALPALATLGRRGLVPLLLWGTTGVLVFVAGWPWLWPFDFPGYPPGWSGTIDRLREFLAVGIDRATVYVWYFGKQFPRDGVPVPWHFVWVFFLATVPLGLQIVGFAFGVPRAIRLARTDRSAGTLLSIVAVVLITFSLPLARYDGERLFLLVSPPWGIVIGVGCSALADRLSRWIPRSCATGLVLVLLTCQSIGIVRLHPFQLSYYSAMVGGLPGASRLGLEATYWGDTVDESILERFAEVAQEGEVAALFPTLYAGHPFHMTSPGMRRKNLAVVPGDQWRSAKARYAILFRREGYLNDPDPLAIQREGEVVAELSRDGVWLTRLYRLPAPATAVERGNAKP